MVALEMVNLTVGRWTNDWSGFSTGWRHYYIKKNEQLLLESENTTRFMLVVVNFSIFPVIQPPYLEVDAMLF